VKVQKNAGLRYAGRSEGDDRHARELARALRDFRGSSAWVASRIEISAELRIRPIGHLQEIAAQKAHHPLELKPPRRQHPTSARAGNDGFDQRGEQEA
jgi:hypothetical protein